MGSAVSGERAGSDAVGGRKGGTGKRGCAEHDGAGWEAGWVSRQATAGAVAGTRPIGPATGVWTSTRPPPDATMSQRRATAGPYVDRHLDLVSPSPRCLSLGPKKLNTLAGGTLPCLDRAGAPWPPRPCKGRPSESYPSCGAQSAMNFWWRTSVCSASRPIIQKPNMAPRTTAGRPTACASVCVHTHRGRVSCWAVTPFRKTPPSQEALPGRAGRKKEVLDD